MPTSTVTISCDKDELWIRLPRVVNTPDYPTQTTYPVDAELMNAYSNAQRAAEFLRKRIIKQLNLPE